MFFPSNNLKKLAAGLFEQPAAREAFIQALLAPVSYDPAIVWLENRPDPSPIPARAAYDWQPEFVDRVSIDDRPGRHPLHQQGAYYCLDVSSVFAACALYAVAEPPETVLDLCASPGGKSVFAWRLLQPERILANEVIGKRTAALISNLQRCRIRPATVLSRDSSILADSCPQSADLVVVDAPCSGQSLIARGKPSPGCFHPATINMNANRQRRILACAARVVAPGGYLAYITCTYARKENENNAIWLMKHCPHLRPLPVPRLAEFPSHLADFPCYRLWPQQQIGAGAFAVIFRNEETGPRRSFPLDQLRPVWRSAVPRYGSDSGR
jgi:16S rRNA C967 or C1407 C5-methylase (RsmB/RsmF family)